MKIKTLYSGPVNPKMLFFVHLNFCQKFKQDFDIFYNLKIVLQPTF